MGLLGAGRETLHPSAEDLPLTLQYLSVPNNLRHSSGGSKRFPACSFCSMGIATQRVQGSCQTLQTLETNLHREYKKGGNHPGPKMLSAELKQVSSESKSLWQDEHLLLCSCASSRVSVCGCEALSCWTWPDHAEG